MAEEGGISAVEGLSSASDAHYSSDMAQQQMHAPAPNLMGTSRKSTMDVLVESGMATPMNGNKRESKHMMDLDDYFVGTLRKQLLV